MVVEAKAVEAHGCGPCLSEFESRRSPQRPVAQLGRARARHARGHRFDSDLDDYGVVAHLGERRSGRPKVEGSSPSDSTKLMVLDGGPSCRSRQYAVPLGAVEGTLGEHPRAGEDPASTRMGP